MLNILCRLLQATPGVGLSQFGDNTGSCGFPMPRWHMWNGVVSFSSFCNTGTSLRVDTKVNQLHINVASSSYNILNTSLFYEK